MENSVGSKVDINIFPSQGRLSNGKPRDTRKSHRATNLTQEMLQGKERMVAASELEETAESWTEGRLL